MRRSRNQKPSWYEPNLKWEQYPSASNVKFSANLSTRLNPNYNYSYEKSQCVQPYVFYKGVIYESSLFSKYNNIELSDHAYFVKLYMSPNRNFGTQYGYGYEQSEYPNAHAGYGTQYGAGYEQRGYSNAHAGYGTQYGAGYEQRGYSNAYAGYGTQYGAGYEQRGYSNAHAGYGTQYGYGPNPNNSNRNSHSSNDHRTEPSYENQTSCEISDALYQTLLKSSLYNDLDIAEDASSSDIRKKYRDCLILHHPDKGGNEEVFKKISFAYETLKDDNKKEAYDQFLQRFKKRDPNVIAMVLKIKNPSSLHQILNNNS